MSDYFDFDDDLYELYYADEYDDFESSRRLDPLYYHDWYELVAFHKEFEKAILITLRIDYKIRPVLVPKSIIRKMETINDYLTNETQIRYLIHTKTLQNKLPLIDIFYTKNNVLYKFVNLTDGNALVTTDYNATQIPFDELIYSHWSKR